MRTIPELEIDGWTPNPEAMAVLQMFLQDWSSIEAERLLSDLERLAADSAAGGCNVQEIRSRIQDLEARFGQLLDRARRMVGQADRISLELVSRRLEDGWTSEEVAVVAETAAPLIFRALVRGVGLDALMEQLAEMTSGSPGRSQMILSVYAATGEPNPHADDADVVYLVDLKGQLHTLTPDRVNPTIR